MKRHTNTIKTMNNIDKMLTQVKNKPQTVEFQDVITLIDNYYQYTPTRFINGPVETGVVNAAGENEGSCKIFSFAKLNELNIEQTLNCFGKYYRDDVLKHPEGSDHQNIRTFIKYGWEKLDFDGIALKRIED